MHTISLRVSSLALMSTLAFPSLPWAASEYEERLAQLAEGITAEAVKANKQRLAILDLTDFKGNHTALGQFLADEIGTQLLIAGELNVVERTLVRSTLEKLGLTRLDRTQAKTLRRAAKAVRADAFLSGVYWETPEGVQITTKLISPLNGQTVGAARGTIPNSGPLGQLVKDVKQEKDKPLVATIEAPKEPPASAGLGVHRNEYYELVVHTFDKRDGRAKLGLTVENRSSRALKMLCLFHETTLRDEEGTTWRQTIEDNRDGLCTRGVELSPGGKEHVTLTFNAPTDSAATEFTLRYREKLPRRDVEFMIEGLTVGPDHTVVPSDAPSP